MASTQQRIHGALLGLAVSDALGAPVEFQSRGSFPLVDTMLPNGNFGLPAGCFTDDTSQVLCLAHSLLVKRPRDFDYRVDQIRRYLDWWRNGYMSSVGQCFDIGVMTQGVLKHWEKFLKKEYDPILANTTTRTTAGAAVTRFMGVIESTYGADSKCGNGSLMRTLPAGLLPDIKESMASRARQCSKTTHPHRRCQDSCVAYVLLVREAVLGKDKTDLSDVLKSCLQNSSTDSVLRRRFGGYKTLQDWHDKPESDISSSGYVVDSLEAALWAFFSTDSFKAGAIKVVNLGDDADTVGAIYGGLVGAFYGVQAIPKEWLKAMKKLELVEEVAKKMTERYEKGETSAAHEEA